MQLFDIQIGITLAVLWLDKLFQWFLNLKMDDGSKI